MHLLRIGEWGEDFTWNSEHSFINSYNVKLNMVEQPLTVFRHARVICVFVEKPWNQSVYRLLFLYQMCWKVLTHLEGGSLN